MRNKFDAQLELLNRELIEMGALIEHAIKGAVSALMEQSVAQAKQAIAFDQEIDEKERQIESLCLKLLLQQQPVARDLRMISAALKMITDMERIGDQAADISEIVIMMADTPYQKPLKHIPEMAIATSQMVTDSVDAFVRRDLDIATTVIESDDVVDALFDTVKQELITGILDDASYGVQALDLLMIAKYFERIGDHAVNVAQWVAFSITGVHEGAVDA